MEPVLFYVSALEKAPVTLKGTLPVEFLDLAENDTFAAAGETQYELTGRMISGGVLVSGCCSVDISAACGRCLKEFEFTLENRRLQMFFELSEAQEVLDVTEDLRAELLLELPMNPVCSETCPGLCPVCGCDRSEKKCSCTADDTAEKVSPWSALDGLDLD